MLPTGSNHLLYYLKSRCILEARNPDELASFSKKIFMKEVRMFWPLWFDCVWGASGLSQNASKECDPETNSLALATVTLARLRNAKASAVHYRISTFMFHSGVKYGDLTSLNHLEVCMSPDWQLRLNRTNQELHLGRTESGKIRMTSGRRNLHSPTPTHLLIFDRRPPPWYKLFLSLAFRCH